MTEETIFQEALALSAEERVGYLDQACSGNPHLRAAVEALLAAHQKPDNVLDKPPGDFAATIDSQPLAANSAAIGELGHDPAGSPNSSAAQTAAADDLPHAAAGVVIAGRYTLQERIGEGGMGEVWVARQTEPVKRKVAIKLIKTGMDSRAVLQRFEQERQALALMDHPNIARVLDGGITPTGRPFFVMELVNGLPLTRFCDELKLTLKARLELFVPICQAVQHAHQKGIVHRDLKPPNILVTMIDGKPVPKVIDFGVAKATSGKLTEETMSTGFGAVVGTLEYMSPEQAGFSGDDIDTRADIYSLGVILYELLTGLRPIDAKRLKKAALTEMIRIIQDDVPSKPSTRLSTEESLPSLAAVRQTEPKKLTALLRGELDWVVMKCLEKQRDRRYETANGLARDIQRYLADETVEARPPSARYRIGKFVRRHKLQVVAATLILLALLAGLFGVSTGLVQAQRAMTAERAARKEAIAQKGAAVKAKERETGARKQAEIALQESRLKTALMTYERAQALCEDSQLDLGLLWMARSLEQTPPDAKELDRAIRTSMNLWARQMTTIRSVDRTANEITRPLYADLSPDGRRLLAAHGDGVVRLWDVETGDLVHKLESGDTAAVNPDLWRKRPALAFSPDGRFVAAIARGDGKVGVWEISSGKLIGGPPGNKPQASESQVSGPETSAVAFDSQSKLLATTAGDVIAFWNIERQEAEGDSLQAPEPVGGLEFSSDGRWLAAWNGRNVFVWDVAARTLSKTLDSESLPFADARFSPDGKHLLLTNETSGRFWDVEQGGPVGAPMTWIDRGGPGGYVRSSFRADGKIVVTGGSPPRFWEVPSGRAMGAVNSRQFAYFPLLSPDGSRLYVQPWSDWSNSFGNVLDVAPGLVHVPFASLAGFVHAIVPSPDGATFATVEWLNERHRYSLHSASAGQPIGEPIDMEAPPSTSPALPTYSPSGRLVAFGSEKDGLELRITSTGMRFGERLVTSSAVRAMAFSPDGRMVASGERDGTVRIWSTTNGQPIGEPWRHDLAVSRVRFSPDGKQVLVCGGAPGGVKGFICLRTIGDRQPLWPVIQNFGEVHDAAFSEDGRSFATASLEFLLWDAKTGQRLWANSPTSPSAVLAASFRPGGRQVMGLLLDDNSARLFDVNTGQPTGPHLRHNGPVRQATFSPDGALVLTCSNDLTARLWDANHGLPVGPVWTNQKRSPNGAFSADGKKLYLFDDVGLVRWELPAPMEGSPERIRLAVESATRHAVDEYGAVKFLFPTFYADRGQANGVSITADPHEGVRQRLEELGGPPGHFRR